MLRLSFLFISVFCLLGGLRADPLTVFASLNEEVQIETLDNGMTLVVHERLLDEPGVSLRLVWNPPSEHHHYTGWDLSDSVLLEAEEFFQECRNDLIDLRDLVRYPVQWGFVNPELKGDQFAVIVVGNVTLEEVKPLIELYFDDLFSEEEEGDFEDQEGRTGRLGDVYANLKDEWLDVLQERLFERHMELAGYQFQEEWLAVPYWQHNEQPQEVGDFLREVARLKVEGYAEEEFNKVKEEILEEMALTSDVGHAFLASFYSDLFQNRNERLLIPSFAEISSQLVREIVYEEIEEELEDFLEDVESFIEDLYPVWEESPFAFAPNALPRGGWEYQSAVVVDEPCRLVNSGVDPFYSLPLSRSEMRQISHIITTMSQKNVVELAFKKKDLEKRGKKINHVHPLRFMGYILSSSHLRNCAYDIERSSFKWDAFVGGFAKRMREEHSKGNVMPYIHGFAQLLGASVEQIAHYVHKRNFEGLVRYLM